MLERENIFFHFLFYRFFVFVYDEGSVVGTELKNSADF